MRKQTLEILALVAFVVASTAVPTTAQSPGPGSIVVDVPFSFRVGERSLPSGTYVIGRLSPSSSAVLVRSDDGGPSAAAMANGRLQIGRKNRIPKLVFESHGDMYVLTQVWIPGRSDAFEVARSEEDRAYARNRDDVRTVTLAVSR